MKVVIVGGGIGGLSLGLSLCAAGLEDIDIYESAPVVRELGVGINVLPHAVRELTELGLQDELSQIGVATADFTYYSRLGQRIWHEPLGIAAGYRWPQLSIHRGELLGVLHRAVLKRLGPDRIHTNHHFSRFGYREDGGVWAEFVGRDAERVVARAESDLLVGCDGIHSSVRNALYPEGDPLRWSGVIMWRGVSQGRPFLSGRSMVNIGSSKRRTVVYPISRSQDERSSSVINWVATCKVSASEMPPQDWTYVAQREEVLKTFADFTFDFLDVVRLIRDAEAIYQYPMVDKDPLPSWDFGRVTLLGDAAHPMHPVGGNGASQAILDARVLARELALRQTIEAGVSAYDSQRRPATAAVVRSNRKAGPHRCQDLVEARAPEGFKDILDVMTRQELEAIADDYKLVTGSEVERLNSRESLSVTALAASESDVSGAR
ncbi:flavin-dependent oxidoreductase [Amycolatopsis sp. K13G38]|uniref:Flavin-dependent oxidoreductase n=1 Tax=Amycolatopsis acididurans TaxID=2724524 RepID=A0ABX1IXD5_9PSEU|nr:flavin-dependent oxidoreductase [Amycolatopsis acididurans]NKQ52163.1 flavin-dependent oxidoreductase [Amycolatopsis acididurans]